MSTNGDGAGPNGGGAESGPANGDGCDGTGAGPAKGVGELAAAVAATAALAAGLAWRSAGNGFVLGWPVRFVILTAFRKQARTPNK